MLTIQQKMNLILEVFNQNDRNSELTNLLYDSTIQYLWDSGKGCCGIDVWNLLPKDIVVHIMNVHYSEQNLYSRQQLYAKFCLINKNTKNLAEKYFNFNFPQYYYNHVFASKIHDNDNSSVKSERYKDLTYIEKLIDNVHFDKVSFLESIKSMFRNRKNHEVIKLKRSYDWTTLYKIIRYLNKTNSLSDCLIGLSFSLMLMQNPPRDYELIVELLQSSQKIIILTPLIIPETLKYELKPFDDNIKSIFANKNSVIHYEFYCSLAKHYNIIMPTIEIDSSIDSILFRKK